MFGQSARFISDFCAGVLDLVYPPHCLICKQHGSLYLCAGCAEKINLIEQPFCRKCGVPCGPEAYTCHDCRVREYRFECACSAGVYDGVLREAIHALKYGFHIPMADPLAAIMIRAFPGTNLARRVDLAVPIPAHRSRLVERGFNQSEELARRLCEAVGLPIETRVLIARRATHHQANLPLDARAGNVEGAFAVANPERVVGKRVLVIDDVLTTGATVNEAAKVLLEAGAVSVCAFTLARSV